MTAGTGVEYRYFVWVFRALCKHASPLNLEREKQCRELASQLYDEYLASDWDDKEHIAQVSITCAKLKMELLA